ncbi:DUF6297 family protein [Nocardioides terrisoli]|uniref:DUF6297 family protein n=1 Tax=Nocardioides terrisoli TaxID=3388267 RepID=UPI00287B7638|nr:DUF6297 family protein [Nocardioides marmorisolisilvae]
MVANVVINVGRVSGQLCTSAGCREGRTALPWLVALAALLLVVAVARLFGPVFVSPATASWLLPAPIDRPSVLRPRLVWALLVALPAAALLAAVGSTLAGFAAGPVAAFAVSAGGLAVAGVGIAALAQSRRGIASRVLVWLLAALLWAALLVLALGVAPRLESPRHLTATWWAVLAAAAALAVALGVLSVTRLGRLRDRDVAPGGSLAPGLSGALATLDLALLYDVLVEHRWRGHATVRSRRGLPAGPEALVRTEVTRMLRSPQTVVVLAAAVVAPYAVAATGAGRLTLLVAALAGFLAGLPLLVALRVLTRTPSLLRMLPFPVAETRRLVLRLPGLLLIAFGLACVPAVHAAVGGTPTGAVGIGFAIGLSALASAVRWVTGRPPDYSRPLVSTPAGGVPTNLYGSALRGFDMLLVTTAPLLLSPTGNGAFFSLVLSLVVLGYLTARQ